jgi:formate/nitrite transporter FocA (FNT family)
MNNSFENTIILLLIIFQIIAFVFISYDHKIIENRLLNLEYLILKEIK